MGLTFYHVQNSTSNVTEAILAELSIPHDVETLSIQAGDTRAPSFRKINPNGRVPVIVHDGTAIWESAAITLYLGEVFGVDAKLFPAQGPSRGEAMKWIIWSNINMAAAGGRLAATLHSGSAGGVQEGSLDTRHSGGEAVAKKAKDAREELDGYLKVLEGSLERRPYLLGDEYSLVDTHLQSLVGWLEMMKVSLTPFPNTSSWLKRCGERPALKKLTG